MKITRAYERSTCCNDIVNVKQGRVQEFADVEVRTAATVEYLTRRLRHDPALQPHLTCFAAGEAAFPAA